ncbi:MAG: NUDIX domain-containing protein [Promethearchaeota archaeon]|nr:MAG: NUDIX domain-containing protein [Candidatus Lokiarchaeota archaeon]
MEITPKLDLEKLKYDLRKYPVRPHIGIGGLLLYRNRILLIKRKYDPGANLWSIPGGHLKLGETCEEGAEREFLEETTITARARKLAGLVDTLIYDDENKLKYHYVLINYFMEIEDSRFSETKSLPKLEAQSDAADIAFVPIENISDYPITKSLRTLLVELNLL